MQTHPHVTSISDWERGDYPPGARHLIELGRLFGERPPADGEDDEEEADPVGALDSYLNALVRRAIAAQKGAPA